MRALLLKFDLDSGSAGLRPLVHHGGAGKIFNRHPERFEESDIACARSAHGLACKHVAKQSDFRSRRQRTIADRKQNITGFGQSSVERIADYARASH